MLAVHLSSCARRWLRSANMSNLIVLTWREAYLASVGSCYGYYIYFVFDLVVPSYFVLNEQNELQEYDNE